MKKMSKAQAGTKDLREAHCKHIVDCLPDLIKWTNLTSDTISIFTQRGVLGSGDLARLRAFRNEHDRNLEFYTIIQTRLNFFQILVDAMDSTCQTGVVSLLKSFKDADGKNCKASYSSASSNPRKYFRVPSALQEFVLQSSTTRICVVVTVDTEITLEKIRENLQGVCYVHKSLHAFRKYISSSREPQANSSNHQVVPVVNFGELRNIINDTLKVRHAEKLVLVTPQENEEFLEDFPEKCLTWAGVVQLGHDEMEWDDLSPNYKQHIRTRLQEKYKIDFEEDLATLLHGDVLVSLIHGMELKLFKETIPKQLDYYVERVILTRNVISNKMFELKREESQGNTFLLTGIKRWELTTLVKEEVTGSTSEQLVRGDVNAKFMILDQPIHFGRICDSLNDAKEEDEGRSLESVHLFHRDPEKRLRWQKTSGCINGVQTFIDKAQDKLTEEEFIRNLSSNSSLAICISDSPGMGKSVLLGQLARKLTQLHPNKEIIFLNIVHFIHQFNEIRQPNADDVLEAIQNLICENPLARAVLKLKFSSVDMITIELLLDGFDELESANYNVALGIICKIVSSIKSIRLWVTSRRHFLRELEATLTMLGYMISPFSHEDQIQFLLSYWSRNRSLSLDEEKLKLFARECLKEIKSGFSSTHKDVTGIPLQCRLIGEVYEKAAAEFSEIGRDTETDTEPIFQIRSIRQLFEKTIEDRFKKYEEINEEDKLSWKEVMDSHYRVALEFLFPEYFQKLESLFRPLPREEILKVGTLEAPSIRDTAPEFVHRTYAEYFIAWWLMSKLTSSSATTSSEEMADSSEVSRLLTKFLFQEILSCDLSITEQEGSPIKSRPYDFKHNVVIYFINSLLNKCQLEVIKTNFHNNFTKPQLTHVTMEQLTQACANSDFTQLFKLFIKLDVFPDDAGVSLFDQNFLFLSIKKSSCEFVEVALEQFEKFHEFDQAVQRSVLLLAVSRGDFSILEIFLNQKQLYKLVEQGEVPRLLHECVKFTKSNSEREIEQRTTICHTLVHYNKAALEEKNESGMTPLLRGDVQAQLKVTLIELGAHVLSRDAEGDTVLHLNYIYGSPAFTNQEYHTLITGLCDEDLKNLMNTTGSSGDLPLERFVKKMGPSPKILQRFHDVGFDFNSPTQDHHSLLATAIKSGRGTETIQNLIELGANIEWEIGGRTLLHIGVESGNVEAVEVLLGKELIDVNSEDEAGFTALEDAIHCGKYKNRFETGKLLHERGCSFKEIVSQDFKSWLHVYSRNGDYESVQLLLHCGVLVHSTASFKNTPLHFGVVGINNFDITQLLLEHGADPNITNSYGKTPFHNALENEDLDLETYNLLKSKTNVKWSEELATLALQFAMRSANCLDENEFYSMIEECVEHGGNLNCRTQTRNTPLHMAADKKDLKAVQLLVQNGASINLTNGLGQTPLHRAALHSLDITKYLIWNGANVHLRDDRDRTFLHLFASNNNDPSTSQLYSIVSFLVERDQAELFDSTFMGIVQGSGNVLSLIQRIRPNSNCEAVRNAHYEGLDTSFEHIIIGSRDFSISRVVGLLKGAYDFSSVFHYWTDIARELGLPSENIRKLQNEYILNKLSPVDVFYEIIETWVARQGIDATLQSLAQAFENNGFNHSAYALIKMGSNHRKAGAK